MMHHTISRQRALPFAVELEETNNSDDLAEDRVAAAGDEVARALIASRTLANVAVDALSFLITSAACSWKLGLAIILIRSAKPSGVCNMPLTSEATSENKTGSLIARCKLRAPNSASFRVPAR